MTVKYLYPEKRLHIFDLDDTLYLHRMEYTDEYTDKYHIKMEQMIKQLKRDGKIVALASHNTGPLYWLRIMGIVDYFDHIIGEYPREKDDMIKEILKKTKCEVHEAVFYDDQEYNIEIVSKLGVEVYHVKENGIEI